MILQALYDYYQRKEGLAPLGLEYKEIAFLIVIDRMGNFVRLEDTREEKRAKSFLVVRSKSKTSKPDSNLFWDNPAYVLGYAPDPKTGEKVKIRHALFIDQVNELNRLYPGNEVFEAVASFFLNRCESDVRKDELWSEIEKKPTVNLSFRLSGQMDIVASHPDLEEYVSRQFGENGDQKRRCLITGERSVVVSTTSATPIAGSQSTAKLVSFQVNSGYDSYGKSQGGNAPISQKAEMAYSTALNSLLAKDSRNKFVIGDRTFVFWSVPRDKTAGSDTLESYFGLLFGSADPDNPDSGIQQVIDALRSPHSGWLKNEGDDRFYILGLAPNVARISVQFWQQGTVRQFARHLSQHFDDLSIVKSPSAEEKFDTLLSLLLSVTLQYKRSNIQPNLAEAVMNAILTGGLYPAAFQQACLRRITAEQSVTPRRAAILKACVNRKNRMYNPLNKELKMALDQENQNQGYLCGRLFAVLEYTQERGMNMSNLRERYLNAASTTPAWVFPRILNLSVYHQAKIDNAGTVIFLERLKGEILDKFDKGTFPSRLSIDDQSNFMVGYYQQRQDFFKSKKAE